MTHVFGIAAGRATLDVDFAIAVEDWPEFDTIKDEFVSSGDFQPVAGVAHRLYYRQDEFGEAFPLDLVPFGKVERPGKVIAWPPDMDVVMNVAGYAEALASAIKVDVGSNVVVRVVSIPALTALKILAWNDRGLEKSKDAEDFYFLLRNYHRAANEARLYGEAYSLLESANYDVELAGAALLGYDTRMILERPTREAIIGLLADPVKRDRLSIHMDRSIGSDPAVRESILIQFERGLQLLHV